MKVTGWLSATACSQPGIDSTGTYALDTKVKGDQDHRYPLGRLSVARIETHRYEHPLESEDEDDDECRGDQCILNPIMHSKANEEAHDRHHDQTPQLHCRVGKGTPGEYCAAGDRQGPKPIEQPLRDVLGDPDCAA